MPVNVDLNKVLKRVLVVGDFGTKKKDSFVRFRSEDPNANLSYDAFVKVINPADPDVGVLDERNVFFQALKPFDPPSDTPSSTLDIASSITKRIVKNVDNVIKGMQVFSDKMQSAITKAKLQNLPQPAGLAGLFFANALGQLDVDQDLDSLLDRARNAQGAAAKNAAQKAFGDRATKLLKLGDNSPKWAIALLDFSNEAEIQTCQASYRELHSLVTKGVLDSVNRTLVIEHLRGIARNEFYGMNRDDGQSGALVGGVYLANENELMYSVATGEMHSALEILPYPIQETLDRLKAEGVMHKFAKRLPAEEEQAEFIRQRDQFVEYHRNLYTQNNPDKRISETIEDKLKLIFANRLWPAITGQPRLLKTTLLYRLQSVVKMGMMESDALQAAGDAVEQSALDQNPAFMDALHKDDKGVVTLEQANSDTAFGAVTEDSANAVQAGVEAEALAEEKINASLCVMLDSLWDANANRNATDRVAPFISVSATSNKVLIGLGNEADRGVKAISNASTEPASVPNETFNFQEGEEDNNEENYDDLETGDTEEHKITRGGERKTPEVGGPRREDDSKEDDSKEDDSKEDDSKEDDSKEDDSKEDDSKEDDSKEDDSKEDDSKEDDEFVGEDWEEQLAKLKASLVAKGWSATELRTELAKVLHDMVNREEVVNALKDGSEDAYLTYVREFYFCMLLFIHQSEFKLGKDGSGTLAFTRSLLEHNGDISKLFKEEALNGFYKEFDTFDDENSDNDFTGLVETAENSLPELRRTITSKLSDLYGLQKLFEVASGSKVAEVLVFNGTASSFIQTYKNDTNCASANCTTATSCIPSLIVLADSAFTDGAQKARFVQDRNLWQITGSFAPRQLPLMLFSAGPSWETGEAFDTRWGNANSLSPNVYPVGPGLRFRGDESNKGDGGFPVVPGTYMVAAAFLRKFAGANSEPFLGKNFVEDLPHQAFKPHEIASMGNLVLEHTVDRSESVVSYFTKQFFEWNDSTSMLPHIFAWLGILAAHSNATPSVQATLKDELAVPDGNGWSFSAIAPSVFAQWITDNETLVISNGIKRAGDGVNNSARVNQWLQQFGL